MRYSNMISAFPLFLAASLPAFAQPLPSGPPPAMPSIAQTSYKTALSVTDGNVNAQGYKANKPLTNSIGANGASGIVIKSDEDDFNGLLVRGTKSGFSLKDSRIDLAGRGSNDFLGLGAGAMVVNGMLLLDNVRIETNGAISSALVAAEQATLKAVDSEFISHGGPLPEGYTPKIGPGMMEPPAPLGITGTARTNLTMSNAHSYFYNCRIVADGWGALSTDAAGGDVYLEANDSTVVVNNSGYGAYADFGAKVVLNRTQVDAATYTGVIAGQAVLEFNDSETTSGGNVVMIHSVMGNPQEVGQLSIQGGNHHSAGAAFLVKSANAQINLSNTSVAAENDNLLIARVNDDKFRTQVNGQAVPGTTLNVVNSTLRGNIINEDNERSLTVNLGTGSRIQGVLKNVAFTSVPDASWLATDDSSVSVKRYDELAAIDAKAGVTVAVSGLAEVAEAKLLKCPSGGMVRLLP